MIIYSVYKRFRFLYYPLSAQPPIVCSLLELYVLNLLSLFIEVILIACSSNNQYPPSSHRLPCLLHPGYHARISIVFFSILPIRYSINKVSSVISSYIVKSSLVLVLKDHPLLQY